MSTQSKVFFAAWALCFTFAMWAVHFRDGGDKAAPARPDFIAQPVGLGGAPMGEPQDPPTWHTFHLNVAGGDDTFGLDLKHP